MNAYSMFNTEDFRIIYNSIISDKKLAEKLAAMPDEYGTEVEDKNALARECMEAVAEYKYAKELARSKKLMKSLENALDNCDDTPERRLERLQRAYSGLTQFYKGENHTVEFECASEEELKQNILDIISRIDIHSVDISSFISMLKFPYCDMYSPASELSRKDYEIKCTVAMYSYLKDGSKENMRLVAYNACVETDMKVLSRAFRAGTITGEKVNETLDMIVYLCCCMVVLFLVVGFISIVTLNPIGIIISIVSIIISAAVGIHLSVKSKKTVESASRISAKHYYKSHTTRVNTQNRETHSQPLLLGNG